MGGESIMEKEYHILLIDDEEVIRIGLGLYLEAQGYTLDYAHNGKHGLTVLQKLIDGKNSPDLLLVDMNMPKMNGHEFIENINQMGINIPLIITEGSLLATHEFPKSENIVNSIKKPFLPQELCKLIEHIREKI